jgi:hypothetical protein
MAGNSGNNNIRRSARIPPGNKRPAPSEVVLPSQGGRRFELASPDGGGSKMYRNIALVFLALAIGLIYFTLTNTKEANLLNWGIIVVFALVGAGLWVFYYLSEQKIAQEKTMPLEKLRGEVLKKEAGSGGEYYRVTIEFPDRPNIVLTVPSYSKFKDNMRDLYRAVNNATPVEIERRPLTGYLLAVTVLSSTSQK